MKIVIIGGHLSPALAFIERLRSTDEAVFIGRKHTFEGDAALSLEYTTLVKSRIKFYDLSTGRLQRRLSPNTLSALSKVPFGILSARKILKKENPDVVIGFGGYLALTVTLAAKSLNIPIVIHEQTLEAGLANKIIAKFANKVCISWPSSVKFFPKDSTILTGNPIRKDIRDPQEIIRAELKIAENIPSIYITGGSSGSHVLNDAVSSCIENLLEDYAVIHQTGDSKVFQDFADLDAKKNSFAQVKKSRYRLMKFIDPQDVGSVIKNADLVISRSGINTVSELLYQKKPALLIPLPFSQRQEQHKNAEMLRRIGLAEIIEQKDLSGITLLKNVNTMLENIKKYTIVDTANTNLIENSAEKIYEVVNDVAKEKNNPQKK